MQRLFSPATARAGCALIVACVLACTAIDAPAQELVLTTGTGINGVPQTTSAVVFPDVGTGLPTPARNYAFPLDYPSLSPHGLALVAANRALTTQISYAKLDLIDTSNATRIESFDLPDPALNVHYDGLGTLAVNPARTFVLAVTDLDTLWVIPAPFDHTAAVTMLALPSSSGTAQTRAIAFDASGRAYIALQAGIAVLDPPYTSIAFTIASANGVAAAEGPVVGAIALSPDGATLAATRGLNSLGDANDVRIFHAPFSAASVPDVLTITGATLDGLTFTPDGDKLIIVDSKGPPRVYAVAAPYSATSVVETLAITTTGAQSGFEDIDISADGQLAALSGGSGGNNDALVLLKAPFTAAAFTSYDLPIPRLTFPYDNQGRGDGTARFWPAPITPALPQVWVDYSVTAAYEGGLQVLEGDAGTTDALIPVNLSAPSAQTVTVDYTTVDGAQPDGATAADNDYIPSSGTLTFAPGETTQNIVVKVVGDTKYENNEHFQVVISNPVNATILGQHPGFADTATVIILNDDAVAPIAITTTALPDGATGVPYSFQMTGTGVLPLKWTMFTPLPPGLTIDPDNGIISGTPIFPTGTTTETFILTDEVPRSVNKSLPLTITGAGIPFLRLDPNPLDFGSQPVGSTSLTSTVTVFNDGAVDLVLGDPFVTIPPGSDFAFGTGANTCTAGQSVAASKNCQIHFTFMPQAAGTRTLNLDFLSNVPTATITLTGVGTGGGGLPVVSIANAASVLEGNSGTTPMTFAVTLSASSATTVTVAYAVTGGTATSGTDYTLAGGGTLTFAPGTTSQNVVVNVIGDTVVEPDETVVIGLSAPVGATIGTASATGIIVNDDHAPAVLTLLSGPLDFGNEALATTSASRTATIGNTGGSNLVLGTPFAPLAGTTFAYVPGPNTCVAGATLAPSASCHLYLTFAPTVLGLATADVLLASSAPDATLALRGTGVTPSSVTAEAVPVPTLADPMLAALAALLGIAGCLLPLRGNRPG